MACFYQDAFALTVLPQKSFVESVIEFDGGCNPNPGRGYGSFRLTMDGAVGRVERVNFGDNQTNNTAEYLALISAIKTIQMPNSVSLKIIGDSKNVIYHVNNYRKGRRLHDTPPRLQLLKDELADRLADFRTVVGEWKKRDHSMKIFGH